MRTQGNNRIRTVVSKISVCIFVLLTTAQLIAGCDRQPVYSGKDENLAATTYFSIPGTTSDEMDDFLILEEDGYGRTMFAASLGSSWLSLISDSGRFSFPPLIAVLIVQKSDDSGVYFYGEENYLLQLVTERQILSEETVKQHFSEAEINELKVTNDWNKPVESNRRTCVKAPVTMRKEDNLPNSAYALLEKKIGSNVRLSLYREDTSGQKVYFALHIIHENVNEIAAYDWYYVMFDSKGKLTNGDDSIWKVSDPNAMADEMKEFLILNNWNDITE